MILLDHDPRPNYRPPRMNRPSFLFLAGMLVLASCTEAPRNEGSGEDSQPSVSAKGAAPSANGIASAPEGMVLIPGGAFLRGGDAGEMGGGSASHQSAYPIHEVEVDPFWIDVTEVTNQQFREFVEATG